VERLDRLLVPYDSSALRARPVSRRVNNARNDDAGLIEPESVEGG
jgi:putative SOS response-associated peptidase YedK